MISIGLTGSLGAGKSTVASLFESWGAARISADELAREVVRPGGEALARIRATWGDNVIAGDGSLDRAALRAHVFADADARRALEEIVHPGILALRGSRRAELERAGTDVLVEEIPLLLEKGLGSAYEVIVVVDAPVEQRRRRLGAKRDLGSDEFARIDAAQWPADRKRQAADFVIENDDSLQTLSNRARVVWDAILTRAPAASRGDDGSEPESGLEWALDLHMHTDASHDCLSAPRAVVERAREVGLQRIAITDHNEIDGAIEASRIDPELVIVGEEVRTDEGLDLIGLFISEHIPKGGDFRHVADEIHRQSGVVYLPHPFDAHRGASEEFLDGVADCVDVVEGINARIHDPERNLRAERWAARHGLPVGAGSDAHLLTEIGRARVQVRPFDRAPDFVSALRDGRIVGRPSGYWVHLGSTWAKLRKRLPL